MSDNKKIYWLASYPKSGNTWFRIFLANYLNDNDKPISINNISTGSIASSRVVFDNISALTATDLTHDEVDLLRPDIYREMVLEIETVGYHKVHDAYTLNINNEPLFPSDVSKGVIYFVRNPLDVAISYANHSSISIDKSIKALNNDEHKLSKNIKGVSNQIRQKLLSWSEHVNSWTKQTEIPVLVLRYEDMLEDTYTCFKNAVNFLELEFNEVKLKQAIEYSSFNELKKQEQKEGFKEKPMKTKSFFKSGKAGNWKQELTKKQVEKIINNNKAVMKEYNYL